MLTHLVFVLYGESFLERVEGVAVQDVIDAVELFCT